MQLTVSATEFQVAWEALSLGDQPLVFWVCLSHGVLAEEEHAQLAATALDGLRQRGLAGATGPAPELADALGLLAGPRWAIDARLVSGHPDATEAAGGSMRAYGVAGRGDGAVLATMADDMVTLTRTTRSRLPGEVAMLAGEVQPGPSRSINVLAELLYAAAECSAGDSHRLADELVARGLPPGDASTIARINAEHRRSGQFSVEVADQGGTLRPGRRAIGFNDTEQGRWAQLRTSNSGQQWLTFTPASATQLAAMLGELLKESGVRAT